MRFSMISKMWASGLMTASIALGLVGCSPESSTSTTTTTTSTSTTKHSSPKASAHPAKEQTGTSLGDSLIDKGREAPEPNAADPDAGDKSASEKPNE